MSKGNPKVVVRLPFSLMQQVRDAVEKRNAGHVSTQHWDVSEYVRVAISDKLKHDERSRRRRRNIEKNLVHDDAVAEVEMAFEALTACIGELDNIADLPLDTQFWRTEEFDDHDRGHRIPLDEPRTGE